jgi:hypothetical protein
MVHIVRTKPKLKNLQELELGLATAIPHMSIIDREETPKTAIIGETYLSIVDTTINCHGVSLSDTEKLDSCDPSGVCGCGCKVAKSKGLEQQTYKERH